MGQEEAAAGAFNTERPSHRRNLSIGSGEESIADMVAPCSVTLEHVARRLNVFLHRDAAQLERKMEIDDGKSSSPNDIIAMVGHQKPPHTPTNINHLQTDATERWTLSSPGNQHKNLI